MTFEEQRNMILDGLEANMNFLAGTDESIFYAIIKTAIIAYLHRNPNMNWEKMANKLIESVVTAPDIVLSMYGKE